VDRKVYPIVDLVLLGTIYAILAEDIERYFKNMLFQFQFQFQFNLSPFIFHL